VLPYVWAITIALFAVGLYGALVTAPPDYQQGETVRIMYVHVPAAWMALFVYTVMALASAVAAIFRHPLADVAAKTAAPIGAVFCFLSLATGSLWGKPMWGAWWVWDARLTSMFVLMLLYIGYMAIWAAIEEPHRAAMVARVVALVGFINIPIVKFSVDWWNSLHQPASVFRADGPTIAGPMLWPLLVMGLAYSFLFLALHLTAMRAEIAARKIRQIQIAEIGER
jgi:heme exporter protein C